MKYLLSCILFAFNLYSQEITAHRGASYDAPENTLEAFKLAWEKGADYIEGDFFLTKDGKVVCFHDKHTGRLSTKKLDVEQSNWSDLKNLDVGIKKGKKWRGVKMPLLDDVLKTIPKDKGIFLEIKSDEKIVPLIKEIVFKSKVPLNNITIICFNENVLLKCKEIMPNIKTQWLVNLKKRNYTIDDLINKLKKLKVSSIGTSCYLPLITKENVAIMKNEGFNWNVWTVNRANDAEKISKAGVDYITTDRPEFIRKTVLNK